MQIQLKHSVEKAVSHNHNEKRIGMICYYSSEYAFMLYNKRQNFGPDEFLRILSHVFSVLKIPQIKVCRKSHWTKRNFYFYGRYFKGSNTGKNPEFIS